MTSEYYSIINGVRQGGVLSPQLFAIYMGYLSVCLTQCNAGCHLNETLLIMVCMLMISVLWREAQLLYKKMLNLCYEFSQFNDTIFNSIKSQCLVFKQSRFKLYCPAVYLNGNIIDFVEKKIFRIYVY